MYIKDNLCTKFPASFHKISKFNKPLGNFLVTFNDFKILTNELLNFNLKPTRNYEM